MQSLQTSALNLSLVTSFYFSSFSLSLFFVLSNVVWTTSKRRRAPISRPGSCTDKYFYTALHVVAGIVFIGHSMAALFLSILRILILVFILSRTYMEYYDSFVSQFNEPNQPIHPFH